MNRSLLLLCFVLFSPYVLSQVQTDIKGKKATGSYTTSFQAQRITGKSSLKSAAPVSFSHVLPKVQMAERNPGILSGMDTVRSLFIEKPVTDRLKSARQLSASEQAFRFMENVKNEYNLANPSVSFNIAENRDDELGQRHIRMEQRFKGIKVYNSDFYLHFSDKREILNGKVAQIRGDVKTTVEISSDEALAIVKKDLSHQTHYIELPEVQKNILNYSGPSIDTILVEDKRSIQKFHLAYHISVRPNFLEEWRYFVDASNGNIIRKYNNTRFDGPVTASATDLNGIQQQINTYLEKGTYYLMDIAEPMFNAEKGEGFIWTLDAKNSGGTNITFSEITSSNNTWLDKGSVSAHYNAIQAYRYLKDRFGRNSINGIGGNIISFINVTEEDGSSMENAFWNGKAAFYGNGGTNFKPLAGAFDVAAHELGHGVIDNTANLEYQDQPGAINETYADIFGAMAERKNWYIGEDVTKTSYIASGRLRDMSNPHNGGSSINDPEWQPKHLSEIYSGTDDNGGVHTNSGIGNYAFYLFATATSKDIAEKVFYRALTTYLNRFSQFIDFRLAVVQSAKDLYGDTSVEVSEAKKAFDTVGIYEEKQPQDSGNLNTNPGDKYLLTYNIDASNVNSLYQSSIDGTGLVPLTTTVMKGKVSVTDNGSSAVFVSNDDELRSITLGTSPVEKVISPDVIWDNAAISKDGKRLAAITMYEDTSIYVYDYNSAKWARFYLYNPTTQTNIKGSGARYADAIEFDHTGEYLIFDAFNSIVSLAGDSINYWDIGLIHVWDNAKNKFADGTVTKLYGSLPDNVSIGNPVFSKNSPDVIAFDYWDEKDNNYYILGLNIGTMDLKTVFNNLTLGYPAFSVTDDKLAFNAIDTENNEVVARIGLGSDKISASGSASVLVNNSIWPVYYATGTRILGLAPKANFTASYKSGTAPLTVNFTDLSENDPVSWQWTFQSGTPSSSALKHPVVVYNNPGTYNVTLKATNAYGENSITKSAYITVTGSTGIPTIKEQVVVYPNPVTRLLFVDGVDEKSLEISIWTLDGKMLKQVRAQKSIDLTGLAQGLYIARVEGKNFSYQVKIVKE